MELEHLSFAQLNQKQRELMLEYTRRYNLISNPRYERSLNERFLTETVAIIHAILTIVDYKIGNSLHSTYTPEFLTMFKRSLHEAQNKVIAKLQILRKNPAYPGSNFHNMKDVSARRTGSYACMQLCNPYTV